MHDDFDFFEQGFEEMVSDQKKSAKTTSTKFPISYFSQPGTYIFRLYPENYNGKPRMRRIIWSNQLHKFKRVLSTKEDKRVDNLLNQYKNYSNDFTKLWSHKVKQEAIMMGFLISGPKHKNIQPENTASLFVLDWKQLSALDSFFNSLEAEGASLRSFLHPNKPSNAIKITVEKVQKGEKTETVVNVSATMSSEYTLPAMDLSLPNGIEFPGLDNLHVPINSILTDDLFNEFKTHVEQKVKEYSQFKEKNNYNPEDQNQEKGYQIDQDEEALNKVGSAAKK